MAGMIEMHVDETKIDVGPEAEAEEAPAKKFWVSWYSAGEFEMHSPWWISGYVPIRHNPPKAIFCAAVIAISEEDAKAVVYASHDEPPAEIEFRFVEERADDWVPYCGRFPKADWMWWPENFDV